MRSRHGARNPWIVFLRIFNEQFRRNLGVVGKTSGASKSSRLNVTREAARVWRRLDATKKRAYASEGADGPLQLVIPVQTASTLSMASKLRINRKSYVFRSRSKELNGQLAALRSLQAAFQLPDDAQPDEVVVQQLVWNMKRDLRAWQNRYVEWLMRDEGLVE